MKRITLSLIAIMFVMVNITAQLDTMMVSNFTFVGTTYGSGDDPAALFNDLFVYNPINPTATTPMTVWDGGVTHCVLKDASPYGVNYMGFDATPKSDTKIYAIDLWGREGGNTKDRNNYLYFEIANATDTFKLGPVSDLYDSGSLAYARVLLTGLPESLLSGKVSVKITQKEDSENWIDLYEVRMVAMSTLLPEIGVTLSNAIYGDSKVDQYSADGGSPANAISDMFAYNPLLPAATSPVQEWNKAEQCFVKNTSGAIDTLKWECDIAVDSGKMLYAVDIWGRNEPQADPNDGRTKDLIFYLISNDGSVQWQSIGFWNGVPEDASAYGRYVFPASEMPMSLLTDSAHFVLGKRAYDTKFLHLAELRMVAVDIPDTAPVANAGPDQEVETSSAVTLDGSASSDVNGDSLEFSWVSLTDPVIVLSEATDTMPTFTAPSTTGDYLFELTITANGLSSVDTVLIAVSTPTRINENSLTFNVYPNPSSQGFFVDLSSLEGKSQMSVISLSGQVIYQVSDVSGMTRISADVLKTGVCFLQVKNNNSSRIEKIIVK